MARWRQSRRPCLAIWPATPHYGSLTINRFMWSSTFLDEIGYLAYDAHAADLLFQIVTRRYEQKSIVLSTNLAFRDWQTIFPNGACAVGLIDRLAHHASIIKITGDSYRRREADGGTAGKRGST